MVPPAADPPHPCGGRTSVLSLPSKCGIASPSKLTQPIHASKAFFPPAGPFVNSPFPNKKFIIDTNQAPRAIGPYSQAVGFGGLLFVSGQIPVDPKSGEIAPGGVEAQTRQVMNNLQAVLMAAGLDFSHVLKTTVYLRNMNDYELVNDAYTLYFDYSPPARVCVEVSRLPKDVLVEIDAIAAAPTDYENRTSDDENGEHTGPDDWEAQHLAEAEAAHAEIGDDDEPKESGTEESGTVESETSDADHIGPDENPGEERADGSDDDASTADVGDSDTTEAAPEHDSSKDVTQAPDREENRTQELAADDLQDVASPAPPRVPKISVPKPTKKDRSED